METARMVEISAISADDLENVRKLGRRMRTYAIVTADDDLSQRVSTGVDEEGGCDPVWKDKLQLTVMSKLGSNMALNIQIFCKTMHGQKCVGWSRVPLSDIFNGFGHPHSLNCLSYRLKNKEGRPHGTVNFSLRFLQPHHVNPTQFFTTFPQQGRYQNTPESARLSGVTMGTYPAFSSPSPYANANANYQMYPNTPLSVYPHANANANYQMYPNIPLSVYPPPHHKQMYA